MPKKRVPKKRDKLPQPSLEKAPEKAASKPNQARSQSRSRLVSSLVLLGCAVLVVVAATRKSAAPNGSPSSEPVKSAYPDEAAPGLSGALPHNHTSHDQPDDDPLQKVRAALRGLEDRSRKEHVRVLFFGDSHAQGEMWTARLRDRLQARFGNGGPGFAFAGSGGHRNDALHIEAAGAFTSAPRQPSTTSPTGDGKLGLGGILSVPESHPSRLTLSPKNPPTGNMGWDICTSRGTASDKATASCDGCKSLEIAGNPGNLIHTAMVTTPPHRLQIDTDGTRLCGVVGERDPKEGAGVVLDALGINGARYRTALAWDEESFVSELQHRRADLVILEYGTNEEGDLPPHLEEVSADVRALVKRIRRGAPNASCLILGPTERNDRVDTVAELSSAIQTTAEELGCAFWSTYDEMGGRGAMRAWQNATPQLAQHDGIHLTADGYEKLGDLLFEDLVRGVATH